MIISKEFKFEASHILPNHPGKCRNLHGHSWRVMLEVEGAIQPESQFVLDYNQLSALVDPVLEVLDHTHLNWLVSYPSSENIAIALGDIFAPLLQGGYFEEVTLRVSETQKTWTELRLGDLAAETNPLLGFHPPLLEELKNHPILWPNLDAVLLKRAEWLLARKLAHQHIELIHEWVRRGGK